MVQNGIGKMQQVVQSTVYTYDVSNVGYVNIIKVALFIVTSDIFIKSVYLSGKRFESVCQQQPLYVSDGCLTVGWP